MSSKAPLEKLGMVIVLGRLRVREVEIVVQYQRVSSLLKEEVLMCD